MRLRNWILLPILSIIIYLSGPESADDEYWLLEDKIPKANDELKKWWDEFHSKFDYPLYCIILARLSDTPIVTLAQDHRKELADVSGKNCCFIYFRNLKLAKELSPFKYTEQISWIDPLNHLFGIKYASLPCLLFFKDMLSEEYIRINVRGLSTDDLLIYIHQIFEEIQYSKLEPLKALKRLKHAKQLRISGEILTNRILQIGQDFLIKLFETIATKI